MNESQKHETPTIRGWHSWSVVCRSQLIGSLAGALFTVGIIVVTAMFPPQALSYSSIPITVTMEPATIIIKAFGLSTHWFVNDKTGGLAVLPFCLILFTNTLVAFLLGSLVGKFLEHINAKRNL